MVSMRTSVGIVTARRALTVVSQVALCADKALKGDVKSAAELGKMLLDGEGTRSQARHWLELAAEGGVVESQYLLGVHLHEGPGPEEQEGSREAREKVLRGVNRLLQRRQVEHLAGEVPLNSGPAGQPDCRPRHDA